eukprot:7763041-Pyramimonas_sp.AAC.1
MIRRSRSHSHHATGTIPRSRSHSHHPTATIPRPRSDGHNPAVTIPRPPFALTVAFDGTAVAFDGRSGGGHRRNRG